jgi:hypothetical protein
MELKPNLFNQTFDLENDSKKRPLRTVEKSLK